MAEDVQAILKSAIKEDEVQDTTSFYSNGLDAIDQSVLSNRQRLNDTQVPRNETHSKTSAYQPAEHHMSTEAIKNPHMRTLSKANADLADELDTLSVRVG